ncbi:MAG: peptidylprolyl isomerase [Bacteroidota bacterium]|nr:peptidylprolyl isomerase [Bacteroidota bacterium]
MATLQNIRNRSGLLLAVIGIAMLAFILGDLLKSTNSGGGNGIHAGQVLGEDILIQTFQKKVDEGIENWKAQNQQATPTQTTIAQIRDQIWEQYVKELVMENEFEELGIDISNQEWVDRISGFNVHPEVSAIPLFQDPVTGVFDGNRAIQYLQGFDQDETGQSLTQWIRFQKYLINLIKNSKYNSLVGKAMFTTNEEAKNDFNSNTKNVTFNYVAIPFASINDVDVEPVDSELEAYYSDHKSEYEQEASKDVDFVVYTVVPSAEDDATTKAEIIDLVADFETYDDYELMARRNSDNTNSRFVYTTEDGLQDPKWKKLFNAKKGTVFGPYLTSPGVYRIAKLAEVQYRPDSVEARHILIKPTQTMSLDSVNKKIDVLKLAIEGGADFGVLARQNSEDEGSAIKGGNLDWFEEGQMVDEFNEACFTSKRGDLSVVTSQFGVHLIEVTKISKSVKKVKIAYIDRNVEPSTETFYSYESQATQFVGKILNEGVDFDTLIATNNLVKRSDNKVTVNKQTIAGLPNSREMVKWMNTADVGSVSEQVFQFDNSYVVAYVTKEYAEGVSALEDIKEEITALVIKEKKAAKILESITTSDLASIASAYETTVVSDQKATFANLSIQGIGYEPELVGGIFANKVGIVSSPITGRNAIYIVEVIDIDETSSNGDFSSQKSKIQTQASSYANSASYNALKAAADVQDNRADFY